MTMKHEQLTSWLEKIRGFPGGNNFSGLNLNMLTLGVCLLSGVALRAGETIADFDFGKPGKEWNVQAKGSFKGSLPEGLEPDFPG